MTASPPTTVAAPGPATPATGASGSPGPRPGDAVPWLSAGQPQSRLTIAISGLALTLFLVAHLGAVSLALLAPLRFEMLAGWLHGQPWLPALELALLAGLLTHPALALTRTVLDRSRGGRVIGPRRSRRQGGLEGLAALAGRWLPLSGGVLLLFLAVHLGQLRWPRPPGGAERQALLEALGSPATLALYGLAGLAVGLHLLHGLESAQRSLGLLEHGRRSTIRRAARPLALLLGAGFTLLPLALVLQQRLAAPSLPPG